MNFTDYDYLNSFDPVFSLISTIVYVMFVSIFSYRFIATMFNPRAAKQFAGLILAIGVGFWVFEKVASLTETSNREMQCIDNVFGEGVSCSSTCQTIKSEIPMIVQNNPGAFEHFERSHEAYVCRGFHFYTSHAKDLAEVMLYGMDMGTFTKSIIVTIGILTLLLTLLPALRQGEGKILMAFLTSAGSMFSLIFIPDLITILTSVIGGVIREFMAGDSIESLQSYLTMKEVLDLCKGEDIKNGSALSYITSGFDAVALWVAYGIMNFSDAAITIYNIIVFILQTVYIFLIPLLYLLETFKGNHSPMKITKYINVAGLIFIAAIGQEFMIIADFDNSAYLQCTSVGWSLIGKALLNITVNLIILIVLLLPIIFGVGKFIVHAMIGSSGSK